MDVGALFGCAQGKQNNRAGETRELHGAQQAAPLQWRVIRQVDDFRVGRHSGTNAKEVLGFLVLKDRFTLGKPRRAERDYGEGLKPKYRSKPLNKGFDWR